MAVRSRVVYKRTAFTEGCIGNLMEHVLGAPPRGRSRLLSLYTPTGDPQTRCEWSIHTKIIVFTQGLHLFGARPCVSYNTAVPIAPVSYNTASDRTTHPNKKGRLARQSYTKGRKPKFLSTPRPDLRTTLYELSCFASVGPYSYLVSYQTVFRPQLAEHFTN